MKFVPWYVSLINCAICICFHHKNQYELRVSSFTELRLNAVGHVLGAWWMVSSARLMHDYKAHISHFEATGNDRNRDSKENVTYKGLKMMQTRTFFVLNMGLLLDALTSEDLSLELQTHSISLLYPLKLLYIRYQVSESVCPNQGQHLQQALSSAIVGISKSTLCSFAQGESDRYKKRLILQKPCENLKNHDAINKSCTLLWEWQYWRWVQVQQGNDVFGRPQWNKMADRFRHLFWRWYHRTLISFSM